MTNQHDICMDFQECAGRKTMILPPEARDSWIHSSSAWRLFVCDGKGDGVSWSMPLYPVVPQHTD